MQKNMINDLLIISFKVQTAVAGKRNFGLTIKNHNKVVKQHL